MIKSDRPKSFTICPKGLCGLKELPVDKLHSIVFRDKLIKIWDHKLFKCAKKYIGHTKLIRNFLLFLENPILCTMCTHA